MLASTGGTVASALALSVAVLAGSGVEADESSVHVKLWSENDVGPVVAAPVSGVESAPSMCPSLRYRWQGRDVVFPSKTQAQKKTLAGATYAVATTERLGSLCLLSLDCTEAQCGSGAP